MFDSYSRSHHLYIGKQIKTQVVLKCVPVLLSSLVIFFKYIFLIKEILLKEIHFHRILQSQTFEKIRICYVFQLGMTMKLISMGVRPNPSWFWQKISELIGYEFGFGNYPIFLIKIGVKVGDENVIICSIFILVLAPMMKLLKFYYLLVNFFYNFYII